MYGRQQQQPPAAYPRQYGQGPPQQQHHHHYPPQAQQHHPQYAPQYPPQQQHGAYAQQQAHGANPQRQPHGAYPPQQPHGGYPQQPLAPAYGAQYGAPSPGHGGYGHTGGPPPTAAPSAARASPYGARAPSSSQSSYESQAQRWKNGFSSASSGGSGGSTAGKSRQAAEIEAPLITELCSPLGSSYPPREALQKLTRYLPSLDHQYVCELLDDKLEEPIWQVQGKALSVLDTLLKSSEADVYKTHYYYKMYILEALCNSRKELLKARAEKLLNVIRSHVPPATQEPVEESVPVQDQPCQEPSLLSMSPVAAPRPAVNLLGSPLLMAMEEPTVEPPAQSAFGFLNASVGAPQPAATPVQQPAASAFSFMATPPPTVSAPATTAPAAPVVDIFSSLPPPTPVAGLVIQQEAPPEEKPATPKVHDPIHDAFEGLNLDDDDEDVGDDTGPTNGDAGNPLAGFTTASRGTMGRNRNGSNASASSFIKISPNDPIREVFLEVDVPAGPMGLMLDRSIPDMAILQGFLPMPSGERGYLEMHPVLCPGCALVSINSMSVEDKGLEEVGAMLGALVGSFKVLKFKKLMRSGRIVSPANPDLVYVPPPPEKEEAEEEEEDVDDVEENTGDDHYTSRLTEYSSQLDEVAQRIDQLVQRDRANLPVVDMKNQLAQLHGNIEKIQTQGIDAVILGANPPPNADEIRQLRSSLVKRADALTKRIQKIATHGTALSPVVGATVIGSSELSASSFVGGATPPPLQLSQPTGVAPSSSFAFLQSSSAASPLSSPQATAPSGSAFSFMSAGTPSSNSVFAGLDLRKDDATPPVEAEPASAFGFLSASTTTASVPSPTAFGFLRRSSASPLSSPVSAAPTSSAFSFIS